MGVFLFLFGVLLSGKFFKDLEIPTHKSSM